MKWNNYRELSEKTLSTEFHCGKQVENLLHGVMGILTELEELMEFDDEVNKKEEVADVFWYLALLDRKLNLNLEIPTFENNITQIKNEAIIVNMFKQSALLMDILKKKIYYNKSIELQTFSDIVKDIFHTLCVFCSYNRIKIPKILNSNIEKQKARYGDKFSSERAINRNLQQERMILEQ
jgi:NTP pyrophosphatase (non-canonical NTP hydrolase)